VAGGAEPGLAGFPGSGLVLISPVFFCSGTGEACIKESECLTCRLSLATAKSLQAVCV
jgi:hypothetical protein